MAARRVDLLPVAAPLLEEPARVTPNRFAPLIVGLLIAATVTGCSMAGPLVGSSADLPADVQRLGAVRLATADESAGTISATSAIEAAVREAGYDYPDPQAFLVVLIDSPTNPGGDALVPYGVPVWLVRWDNVHMEHAGPSIGISPTVYHYLYVMVDARSGEAIDERYME
jgi:hypothetical protein